MDCELHFYIFIYTLLSISVASALWFFITNLKLWLDDKYKEQLQQENERLRKELREIKNKS